jgi:hypothetical protein
MFYLGKLECIYRNWFHSVINRLLSCKANVTFKDQSWSKNMNLNIAN